MSKKITIPIGTGLGIFIFITFILFTMVQTERN